MGRRGVRNTQDTPCTSTSVYSEDKMVERRFVEATAYEMKLAGNWNVFRLKEETSGKRMSTNVKLANLTFCNHV